LRQHVPPKCRYTSTRLHGVASQKLALLIFHYLERLVKQQILSQDSRSLRRESKGTGVPNNSTDIRFEVLTAMAMKSSVFWNITTFSPMKVKTFSCCLLEVGFLLGLLLNPEDEGGMFLRNVGSLSTDYTLLYPRR
jgi:hypothetical protein